MLETHLFNKLVTSAAVNMNLRRYIKVGSAGGACATAATCMRYAGYMDEMRIWRAALSQTTISTWRGGAS